MYLFRVSGVLLQSDQGFVTSFKFIHFALSLLFTTHQSESEEGEGGQIEQTYVRPCVRYNVVNYDNLISLLRNKLLFMDGKNHLHSLTCKD